MTNFLHNIDDTRAEIMRLESAPVFDSEAWARVLADLESAGRVSALADARRRMETARENQPAMVIGVDMASGFDETRMHELTDKEMRLNLVNDLIYVIANCGRKFFSHRGCISRFELDKLNRIWFIDAYASSRIYTHYTRGRWHGFSEGGTLRDLVIRFRDFIQTGKTVGSVFGPFPEWYSGGDPWGYGSDMQRVYDFALAKGIVEIPMDLTKAFVAVETEGVK